MELDFSDKLQKCLKTIKAKSFKSERNIFTDVCKIMFCSLHNSLKINKFFEQKLNGYKQIEECENKYLEIVKTYDKENLSKIAEFLGILTQAFNFEKKDYLGKIYQDINLNSKFNGQFFTPNHVSELMGEIGINKEDFESKKFLSISDPCCGSGSLIIGAINSLKNEDLSDKLKIIVQDLDGFCVTMCFIQLTLCEVSATCLIGNSLINEVNEFYHTPCMQVALLMGLFEDDKNNSEDKLEEIAEEFKQGEQLCFVF